MAISALFSAPFYTGSATSALVPSLYPVAINGHNYIIDTAQYQRATLDKQRSQFSQGDEPDEGTFNPESFWPRAQSAWYFGAGQFEFDEETSFRLSNIDDEGSNRKRFNTSRGVDPWGYTLKLLNDTREIFDTAETNLKMLTVGGYLHVTVGDTVRFTADPTGASPTWSTMTTSTNEDIVDITTDGSTIFVATASNVESRAVGSAGTMSVFSTQDADLIHYAGGGGAGAARLVVAHDNVLYELNSSGDATAFYTHYDTGLAFTAITDSPVAIFLAAETGNKVRFYSVTPDDVTTALGAPVYAGELPDGETLYAMESYGEIMLLGTSAGLRTAQIGTNQSFNAGALNVGPSLESCSCSSADLPSAVRCFETRGQFAWFGWDNFNATYTGLGRADLSRSTRRDAVVPAFASDLMAAEQGQVTGVATFGDYRYFAVSGKGVYAEYATKVATGFLTTGRIRYGTQEKKIFSGLTVGHSPLAGTITASILKENGTETSVGYAASQTSLTSDLFDASYTGRETQVKLTLARSASDATTGPTIKFWILNAIPAPARVDEIILPIIFADTVRDRADNQQTMDVLAEYNYLKELVSSGDFVLYQEGARSELVRVDKLIVTNGKGLVAQGGQSSSWWQGIVVARLLTKEV
jgi:hypothetical protein